MVGPADARYVCLASLLLFTGRLWLHSRVESERAQPIGQAYYLAVYVAALAAAHAPGAANFSSTNGQVVFATTRGAWVGAAHEHHVDVFLVAVLTTTVVYDLFGRIALALASLAVPVGRTLSRAGAFEGAAAALDFYLGTSLSTFAAAQRAPRSRLGATSAGAASAADWPLARLVYEEDGLVVLVSVVGIALAHLVERSYRTAAVEQLTRDEWLAQLMIRHEQLEQRSHMWDATPAERERLETVFDSGSLSHKILRARVDIADLNVADVIGQGNFGSVSSALWRGRPVATKKLHRNKMSERELNGVKRTAELQLSLPTHPNLVTLIGMAWSIEAASVMLVMELCRGGTLGAALQESAKPLHWRSQKLPIARGVAKGLAFLHSQVPSAIIHRDLKPENVLLDSSRSSGKIGDFGLSREISFGDGTMTTEVGTPLFSAPELIGAGARYVRMHMKYDASVDVWSLGCVLQCVATDAGSPYARLGLPEDQALVQRVAEGSVLPSPPEGSIFHGIVSRCCRHAPAERPAASAVAAELESAELIAVAERLDAAAESGASPSRGSAASR